jgi:protein TonB
VQGRPQFPKEAIVKRINGVVNVTVVVKDGVVAEILQMTGPRVYHNAVKDALAKYRCAASSMPIIASQTFNFQVD